MSGNMRVALISLRIAAFEITVLPLILFADILLDKELIAAKLE